mmetsp:Transcript_12697/g.20920  ORF Transcript_12697/g.20920 Transcript_12697/m.20920 type:complete len:215 (-) Transcript_12697:225-869(-)
MERCFKFTLPLLMETAFCIHSVKRTAEEERRHYVIDSQIIFGQMRHTTGLSLKQPLVRALRRLCKMCRSKVFTEEMKSYRPLPTFLAQLLWSSFGEETVELFDNLFRQLMTLTLSLLMPQAKFFTFSTIISITSISYSLLSKKWKRKRVMKMVPTMKMKAEMRRGPKTWRKRRRVMMITPTMEMEVMRRVMTMMRRRRRVMTITPTVEMELMRR